MTHDRTFVFLSLFKSHCMLIKRTLRFSRIKFLRLKAESPHGDIQYYVWPELSGCPVIMNRIMNLTWNYSLLSMKFLKTLTCWRTGRLGRLSGQDTAPNCTAFKTGLSACDSKCSTQIRLWVGKHKGGEDRLCAVVSLLSAWMMACLIKGIHYRALGCGDGRTERVVLCCSWHWK